MAFDPNETYWDESDMQEFTDTLDKLGRSVKDSDEFSLLAEELVKPEYRSRLSENPQRDAILKFDRAKLKVQQDSGFDEHTRSFRDHLMKSKGWNRAKATKYVKDKLSGGDE